MVLVKILSKSLGDTVAALNVCDKFRIQEGLKELHVICNFSDFFSPTFTEITLLNYESKISKEGDFSICQGAKFEKTYYLDYKFHENLIAGYCRQLGVCDSDIFSSGLKRLYQSEEGVSGYKRVCFSMHSTAQAKHWNFPNGWGILTDLLKSSGYDVVNVDRFPAFGVEGYMNQVPKNSINRNSLNLEQVCKEINKCDFFLGISSGLSWIAHSLGKPVIIISGFTNIDHEFYKKTLRIGTAFSCNSCMNKRNFVFDASDWLYCPVFKGTTSEFGCTKFIKPEDVFKEIKKWVSSGYKSHLVEL